MVPLIESGQRTLSEADLAIARYGGQGTGTLLADADLGMGGYPHSEALGAISSLADNPKVP